MRENDFQTLLLSGKDSWNSFREANPRQRVNFNGTILDNQSFEGYNICNCSFYEASLINCNFNNAQICWSSFFHTNLNNSTFLNINREHYTLETRLQGVNLRWTSFANANLQNVQMKGATLEGVHFHNCDMRGADISNSLINGISSWGNIIEVTTNQTDLIITGWDEPTVTVDNIEIAQFLYLMISNHKIRNIIDSLATKVVLILGSFATNDKAVLDQIKSGLRKCNFIPVVFDFNKPSSRNLTETVSTLAHLSKFIVADLTNSRSIPHELASLIPTLRSVPVVPVIRELQEPYGMFGDFYSCNHVAEVITYKEEQLDKLITNISTVAERKIAELYLRGT
jgi:uncharacterized protein YjbI with pentapeptide repeats